jgi:hypothetical protein
MKRVRIVTRVSKTQIGGTWNMKSEDAFRRQVTEDLTRGRLGTPGEARKMKEEGFDFVPVKPIDELDRRLVHAARDNVNTHLGDVFDPEETDTLKPKDVQSAAWDLAFDGAKDAGASAETARTIADHVSKEF